MFASHFFSWSKRLQRLFALTLVVVGSVVGFSCRVAWAQSPLTSVCKSDPASIKAMLEDPLLAEFFELTCGSQIIKSTDATPSGEPILGSEKTVDVSAVGMPAYQDPSPANQNRTALGEVPFATGKRAEQKPALDSELIDQPDPQIETSSQSAQETNPVVFSKFRFEGQLEIGHDHLARAVAPLMGKPINRERLIYLTQALARTYRDLGWLVSIHLPNQDVSDGKVTVQIKEARFTALEIVDPQGVLENTTLVRDVVQDVQPIGAPVNLEGAKEAQNRLNEIPGVVTQLNLKKGQDEGETVGVVQVAADKPLSVNVAIDNSGSRSTGQERVAGGLVVNNPLRRGDQFLAQFVGSEGLKYGNVSYSVPITNKAWRLGARLSSMSYTLVSDDYVGLDAKGPVQSASIFLQLPFARSFRERVRFDANLSTNRYRHEMNSETYSRYSSDILSMGWSATAMNLLPGLNQTSLDFSMARGRIDLSNSTPEHQSLDARTVGTAGYFSKAKLGFSHRQFVTPKTSVFASIRGQWADKNLDGSERFSLGGSGGVRAYPTGEASGSIGGIATFELQHREPMGQGAISFAGFYDHGEIRVNRDNDFEGANPVNEYSLKGYGLWFGAEHPTAGGGLLGLRLTWARRDGDNAGRSSLTGLDQDGTLDKNRFWLDAYYRY